jgi:hypothetical protein
MIVIFVIAMFLGANSALEAVDNAPVPTWATQSWQTL